ncbi:GPW/gp25 family protein [Acinetobacter sp. ANC 5659]|uniref:GPW/gp25 family protein n=1 Tax=Acinetobacter higginsii TaxID=70347 RepID=UPI001F4AA504|nr:GPW/gp25 family protein [Acinetobacter higginsii]MCH7317944.1 GPW/gp25 family protein [Acinetobacter higginsii]
MMSRFIGKDLEKDIQHIYQSIQDILTTPIGTRIMREEYGSLILQLIDGPFDEILQMQIYAATATAIMRWEPRVSLLSISIAMGDQGSFFLDLLLTLVDDNEQRSLRIPLVYGATV